MAVEKAAAVVKKVWWWDFLNTGKLGPLANSDSFEAALMQAWFMHVQQPPITVTPIHKTPCLLALFRDNLVFFYVQLVTNRYSDSKLNIEVMLVNLLGRLVIYFNKKA